MPNLINLASHDEDGQLQVVVEAPRGSRAKFKYDATEQTFKCARPLCLGIVYRYDRGFVPGTRAEDGDPLDATAYRDMSTYPGVIIFSEAIFVIVVMMTGKKVRVEKLGTTEGSQGPYLKGGEGL
jgi:inorganic pyrophosphatase